MDTQKRSELCIGMFALVIHEPKPTYEPKIVELAQSEPVVEQHRTNEQFRFVLFNISVLITMEDRHLFTVTDSLTGITVF